MWSAADRHSAREPGVEPAGPALSYTRERNRHQPCPPLCRRGGGEGEMNLMRRPLLLAAATAATAFGTRHLRPRLLDRPIPRRVQEHFDGEIFAAGEASVGVRAASGEARAVVICMHGFLEDMRYFGALYQDPTLTYLSINSGGYHLPDGEQPRRDADWVTDNPYTVGTIAYDAWVLNEALAHWRGQGPVRVHGHSRGGAVVVEAARQQPEAFAEVEVILEAPVLPGGAVAAALGTGATTPGEFLLPFSLAAARRVPVTQAAPWLFRPLSPRKRELLDPMLFTPRTDRITLVNVMNLRDWMRMTPPAALEALPQGCVLIPQADRILDRQAMLTAAQRAPGLRVVETAGTSHFISLDVPALVPTL